MSATVGGNVETSTSHICDWLNADDPCHYLSVEAPCPGCGAEWSRVADILRAYTLECTSDCEYAAAFQIAFGE